jgi:hypothetical protein
MGLFFHAVISCYCFLAYLFQCRLISVVVAACCHYHRGEKKVSQYFYFIGSGSVVSHKIQTFYYCISLSCIV